MQKGRFRSIGTPRVMLAALVLISGPALQAGPPGWRSSAEQRQADRFSQTSELPIPWNQLTREAAAQIRQVTSAPTLSRTLAPQAIHCDRELFLFLVRHPEAIVGMWDVMGITKVTTRRTGPYSLTGSDGAGTVCEIDLIYGTPELHIFYVTGSYEGPLLTGAVTGRSVVVLESGYTDTAEGQSIVTGKMHVYMQLDGLGLDLVARTLQSLVWQTTEQNFAETSKFMSQIYSVSRRNPMGMQDLAQRLPNVDESIREELGRLAHAVADAAAGAEVETASTEGDSLEALAAAASPLVPEKSGPRLRR